MIEKFIPDKEIVNNIALLGKFAIVRIWNLNHSQDDIVKLHEKCSELQNGINKKHRFIKGRDFKESDLAFALASLYFKKRLTAIVEDKQDIHRCFEYLLRASRRAVPSRYTLMIALLQTSSEIRKIVDLMNWRTELLRTELCDGKEKRAHLQLLCSLTALLLDSDSAGMINRSEFIRETAVWGCKAGLSEAPFVALQLGEDDPSCYISYIKILKKNQCDIKNIARAIRILYDEGKKCEENDLGDIGHFLCVASTVCEYDGIKRKLSNNSATHWSCYKINRWMDLIPVIPSQAQLEILTDIAFCDDVRIISCKERSAKLLVNHPAPVLILNLPRIKEHRMDWFGILKEFYRNSKDKNNFFRDYLTMLNDDANLQSLFSEEEKDGLKILSEI